MRHRSMRVFYFTFLIAAITAEASAQLRAYKNWPSTPEAYFMSSAEREEWTKVKDDKAAEEFVMRYFERRGPEFSQELLSRIELADGLFPAMAKRGSETLRGKLLIILGAPTRWQRSGGTELRRSGDVLSANERRRLNLYLQVRPVLETLTWATPPLRIRVIIQPNGAEFLQGSKADLAQINALLTNLADASALGR